MTIDHWEGDGTYIQTPVPSFGFKRRIKGEMEHYSSVAIFGKASVLPPIPIIIHPDRAVTQTRCHSKVKITLFS